MDTDKIRALNYIFTYGPGSIYELPDNKTVMILGTDFWEDPEQNEKLYKQIFDERICSGLKIKKLYEPPEPQQVDYSDGTKSKKSAYIPATIFPDWHVCKRCNRLFRYSEMKKDKIDLYRSQALNLRKEYKIYKEIPLIFCPFCAEKKNIRQMSQENFKQFRFSEVFSFGWVVICKNGHIDNPDILTLFGLNKNEFNTKDIEFEFKSEGIELNEQKIWATINGVKKVKTIADLYGMYNESRAQIKCTGKKYWLKNKSEVCNCINNDKSLRLVKKGDSLVYFPQITTSLSIPPFNNKEETRHVGNIIEAIQILNSESDNEYNNAKTKANTIDDSPPDYQFLVRKASRYLMHKYCEEVEDLLLIENYVKLDFNDKLESSENDSSEEEIYNDIDEKNFRKQEFVKLIQDTHDENLDPPFDATAYKNPSSLPFLNTLTKVDDVSITHVVTGFSRVHPPHDEFNLKIQRIGSKKQLWLPGIQVRGEGIFLDFKEDSLKRWEKRNEIFLKKRTEKYELVMGTLLKYNFLFDLDKDTFHFFYLLHSFSHYLINVLSFFSGFNAASMRERIYILEPYLHDNDNPSSPLYGILISTSSGGTEASLGGLARYADEKLLSGLLSRTIDKLKVCSNDPICEENTPHGENHNFSSCFSCLYLPETSCEMHNDFLDRQLLIGDGDGIEKPIGFLNMYNQCQREDC